MRFISVVLLVMAGACDVGSVLGADGGSGSGCVNAATPGPPHTHAAGGTANAGLACIASGCHLTGNTGSGASAFGFAGTLYTSAAGTTVLTGATIQVKTATQTLAAVSDSDGNFIYRGTLTFPAMTLSTKCPSLTPMVGTLTTGGGNCNNCHRPGGTTSPMFLQ